MNNIGIIGGADGPTAILVSSKIPLIGVAAGILLVAVAVIAVVAIIKK